MDHELCIHDIDWLVALDPHTGAHRYLRNAYVCANGDTISAVGTDTPPPAQRSVDGRHRLLIPGLVNVHSHPYAELAYRGVREEHGVEAMYMTGLYERLQAFSLDAQGHQACAQATYAELLLSGVTTLVDISTPFEGWLDALADSGLRAYAAASFACARHVMRVAHRIEYDWHPDGGRESYRLACEIMDRAEAHPCRRLRGMVSPSTLDAVSEDLLRESAALALATRRPFTVHASESVLEVQNMIDREGRTPIQWAADIGILAPGVILGHALFLDEHSWIGWHTRSDLSLIADSGASVAHCPTPFSRYGHCLEHFGRYTARGINMSIGTDTLPANMVDEVRTATVLGRIAARNINATSLARVFEAATLGGARALGRDDLGRIEVGAKADLVLVDLTHPYMRPVRDPLRSLFFSAGEAAISDVFIGAQPIVQDGRCTTIDHGAALDRLQAAQSRMLETAPQNDFLGRRADEIAPLCLPMDA